MNFKHLEGVCKGGSLSIGQHLNQRLLTNGYFLFAFSGEFEVGTPKEHVKATALWEKALAVQIKPAPKGECYGEGQFIGRDFGGSVVAERFIRCFDADATWTPLDQMMIVHEHGALVGVVMPMRRVIEALRGEPRGDLTDFEVFGPFACEENGWYLADATVVRKWLMEAERRVRTATQALDEARDEVDAAREEVRSLRERLKAMPPTPVVSLRPAPQTTSSETQAHKNKEEELN